MVAVFLGLLTPAGCGGKPWFPSGGAEERETGRGAQSRGDKANDMLERNAGWVGWIGRGLTALAAASFVVSFFWPVITRREALYGFLGAFGCFVFQYILLKYGAAIAEVAFWGSVAAALAGGVAFGYPYWKAWRRRIGLAELEAVDRGGGAAGAGGVGAEGGGKGGVAE